MGSFGPPVNLPQKFDMSYYSKQGAITIFSHSFSLRLDHGDKISYRINATSPINFVFSFSNNTRFQYSYGEFHNWGHPQENIFELKNVTSYARNFTVSKTGVYIYEFSVDNPEPISTVSFDAIRQ